MDLIAGSIDTFLEECDDLLAQVEEVVLELEEDANDTDAINRAFRIFHSIKGSGAMVGFREVASFTHHVETLLDHVRSGALTFSRDITDVVLASKDHIEALVAAARGGAPVSLEDEADLLRRLEGLAPELSARSAIEQRAQRREFTLGVRPRGPEWPSDHALSCVFQDLRGMGTFTIRADESDVPPLDALDPATCGLAWTISLVTEASEEEIRDRFIFVESDIDLSLTTQWFFGDEGAPFELFEDDPVGTPAAVLPVEQSRPEATSVAPAAQEAASAPKKAPSVAAAVPEPTEATKARRGAKGDAMVRISSEKLDRLVDLVGELVITQSRLAEVASRVKNPEFDSPVEEIERLVVELREGVLGVRMMAIGTTFSRFKRLVHDLSAQLNKKIDLVTEGAETEIDKSVLDQLVDPLMHLVRNSIDHGIESEEARLAAGKPGRGRILLTAVHAGQHVVITIQDDGKGLDLDGIRSKAVARGLIEAGTTLPPSELFKLIFLPGFSTATEVTDVSGRGVGMDVVKRQIEALRGIVSIASERGKGTTMSLRLPLTLAIIDGLLVRIGKDCYIVPLAAVTETVELPASDRERANGRRAVVIRGELVPYISLRHAFGVEGPLPANEQVVIIQDGEDRVGLVVDHVLGNHQTVIQPLGKFYAGVEVVSGTTIMGDGRAALILDIGGILRVTAGSGDRSRLPRKGRPASQDEARAARGHW